MTYPPQGPQGPYNQGPQGPQGPYGNQGPYGPQGPYNQGPDAYPPPWAGGPQGGFPVGPPPPKSRTGLITSLIIVAILVVGGGGVGAYFLLSKDSKENGSGGGGGDRGPRAAAQTYVRELEKTLNTPLPEVDVKPLKPVTCSSDFAKMEDEIADAKEFGESTSATPGNESKVRIRLKEFETTSDGAKFTMTRREAGDDDTDSKHMTVAKENGDWKVCGIYDDEDGGSSSTSSTRRLPPNPIPTT